MELLKNHHVQIMVKEPPQLNGYAGILQLSDLGKEFIKLIPWDSEYQKTHMPWVGTRGEIHIRREDIRAIVDLDTISESDIEQYSKQIAGRKPDQVGNGPADYRGPASKG